MKGSALAYSAAIIVLGAVSGCGGGGGGGSSTGGTDLNNPPSANAGSDQVVNERATVQLTGSGSDTDGTIVSYAWTQIAGVSASLTDAAAATPTFIAPEVAADEALVFRLTVTDDKSATATDEVSVAVSAVADMRAFGAARDEGDAGSSDLVFTVELDAVSTSSVAVDYSTSDGTATAGSDYTASAGTLTFSPGETVKTISVPIAGDTSRELSETFTLSLGSISGNAVLQTASVLGLIRSEEVRLNDTGQTLCINSTTHGVACKSAGAGTSDKVGQDAEFGRDADSASAGDGRAGFSFTKLDSLGRPLSTTATAWACVHDNVTGLTWETKTDDLGLMDRYATFSWYDDDSATNGGDPGTPNGGSCAGSITCDTKSYIEAVRALNLCGHTDWRLPMLSELASLKDYGQAGSGATIDTDYFPFVVDASYWSASTAVADPTHAWSFGFFQVLGATQAGVSGKSSMLHVLLVRD